MKIQNVTPTAPNSSSTTSGAKPKVGPVINSAGAPPPWKSTRIAHAELDKRTALAPTARLQITNASGQGSVTLTMNGSPVRLGTAAHAISRVQAAMLAFGSGRSNLSELKELLYELRSELGLGADVLRITVETPHGTIALQDSGNELTAVSQPIEGGSALKERTAKNPGSRHVRDPGISIYTPRPWPPRPKHQRRLDEGKEQPMPSVPGAWAPPGNGGDVGKPEALTPLARWGINGTRQLAGVAESLLDMIKTSDPKPLIQTINRMRTAMKIGDVPLRIVGMVPPKSSADAESVAAATFAILDAGGSTFLAYKSLSPGSKPIVLQIDHSLGLHVVDHSHVAAQPGKFVAGVKPALNGVGLAWSLLDLYAGLRDLAKAGTPSEAIKPGLLAFGGLTGGIAEGVGLASALVEVGTPLASAGTLAAPVSALAYAAFFSLLLAEAVMNVHNDQRTEETERDYAHEVQQYREADALLRKRTDGAQEQADALAKRYGVTIGSLIINNPTADVMNAVNDGTNSASGQWKPPAASAFHSQYILSNDTHDPVVPLDMGKPGPGKDAADVYWPGASSQGPFEPDGKRSAYRPAVYDLMQQGWNPERSWATKNYGARVLSLTQPGGAAKPMHRVVAGPYYITRQLQPGGMRALIIEEPTITRPEKPFSSNHSTDEDEAILRYARSKQTSRTQDEFSLSPKPRSSDATSSASTWLGKTLEALVHDALDAYAADPARYPFPPCPKDPAKNADALAAIGEAKTFINGIVDLLIKRYPERKHELEQTAYLLKAKLDPRYHLAELQTILRSVDESRGTHLRGNRQLAFSAAGSAISFILLKRMESAEGTQGADLGKDRLQRPGESARQALQRHVQYLRDQNLVSAFVGDYMEASLAMFSDGELEAALPHAAAYAAHSLYAKALEKHTPEYEQSVTASFPHKEGLIYVRHPDDYRRVIATETGRPTLIAIRKLYHDADIQLNDANDILGLEDTPQGNVTIRLPSVAPSADQRKLVADIPVSSRTYSDEGRTCTLELANGKRITIQSSDASTCRRFVETLGSA